MNRSDGVGWPRCSHDEDVTFALFVSAGATPRHVARCHYLCRRDFPITRLVAIFAGASFITLLGAEPETMIGASSQR